MGNAFEPSLFDRQQPRQVKCNGSALITTLADLKRRGAIAVGMACHRPGCYTVTLDWNAANKKPASVSQRVNESPSRVTWQRQAMPFAA
jgi:hypothetical protein